jgi:hypothetical protein
MKWWRLLRAILRGIRRSFVVWQMNEVVSSGKNLYSCVACGLARSEPCEHWLSTSAESPSLDVMRCAVCGWPLAQLAKLGCVRGNCSLRPRPVVLYDPARAAAESPASPQPKRDPNVYLDLDEYQ